MGSQLRMLAAALMATALAACSTSGSQSPAPPVLGFAPEVVPLDPFGDGGLLRVPGSAHGLAGRTLRIGSVSDIVLMRKEVVLTFDDGPVPGRTERILDALDRHGVKATFLMVGEMARNHPQMAREVAARGHSVGSHTHGHPNLAGMSFESAVAEIRRGETAIAAALQPGLHEQAPFFRFPYLAATTELRIHLAARGTVVIDVDIDSKDYFVSTPDQVRLRALNAIEKRGSGIVLFHDLHGRTAAMLPAFLDDLHARGYKVVHLAPGTPPPLVN